MRDRLCDDRRCRLLDNPVAKLVQAPQDDVLPAPGAPVRTYRRMIREPFLAGRDRSIGHRWASGGDDECRRAGRLAFPVDRVYDGLEQVPQAHDDMERDRATGKLVVRVRH